jgi:CBS domain containing-hemolysin-like protein
MAGGEAIGHAPITITPDLLIVGALVLANAFFVASEFALVAGADEATAGLITLEDLLEELAGEIEEEPLVLGIAGE